jgi:hypothetical protein
MPRPEAVHEPRSDMRQRSGTEPGPGRGQHALQHKPRADEDHRERLCAGEKRGFLAALERLWIAPPAKWASDEPERQPGVDAGRQVRVALGSLARRRSTQEKRTVGDPSPRAHDPGHGPVSTGIANERMRLFRKGLRGVFLADVPHAETDLNQAERRDPQARSAKKQSLGHPRTGAGVPVSLGGRPAARAGRQGGRRSGRSRRGCGLPERRRGRWPSRRWRRRSRRRR